MNNLKKLLALLIAAVMAMAALTACGAKPDTGAEDTEASETAAEDNSVILGTWIARTAVVNGEEYKADELFNGSFLLLFTDNGECRMQHNDEWSAVTWKLNEGGVTLTGDNTYELTFTDENKNKLLMDINGANVTLEKYEEEDITEVR